MSCSCGGRHFCSGGDEMIHRDHRKPWESSSSLGAIVRRSAPKEIVVGDVDLYIWRWDIRLMRLIEHKQANSPEKVGQHIVLQRLNMSIRDDARRGRYHPKSGVYYMRGEIHGIDHGRREVAFVWPQRIYRVDNPKSIVLEAFSELELWNWVYDGNTWTPNNGASPQHFTQADRS